MAARLRIAGILGLGLVVLGAAARPLHGQLKPTQGVAVLAYVIPAALVPALLVRYAVARRWVALVALMLAAFASTAALGALGGLVPLKPLKRHLTPGGPSGSNTNPVVTSLPTGTKSHFALSGTLVFVLIFLVVAVVVGAVVVALRRQPAPAPSAPLRKLKQPEPEELVRRFYSLVGDSLDDLRAEPDPRRAVIAAYARMERGLGSLGIERLLSETPFEYLARVLERLSVSDAAARRLTDLFEHAKFSAAPVDDEMKAAAVSALEDIREEAKAWAA